MAYEPSLAESKVLRNLPFLCYFKYTVKMLLFQEISKKITEITATKMIMTLLYAWNAELHSFLVQQCRVRWYVFPSYFKR